MAIDVTTLDFKVQVLDKSVAESTDVVFVTDEEKEDWYHIVRTQRLGARPELRLEFKEETGRQFLISVYQRFITKAKQLEGAALTEESEAALAERSDMLRFLLSDARALRQRERPVGLSTHCR